MFKEIEDMKKQYIIPTQTVIALNIHQSILVESMNKNSGGKATEWGAHEFDFDEEDEEDY